MAGATIAGRMNVSGSRLIWLGEARLRPLALARSPAWLWSNDATRLIWANPTGVAIFGASSAAALATRRFDTGQPAAAQVARLAETLSHDGTMRVEQLRGFGAGIGRALACTCSRITLGDATVAILIAATEPAGPDLPLAERARRLLAGAEEPVAVFGANGEHLAATSTAPAGAWSLAASGFAAMSAEALRTGHAEGQSDSGPMALDRIDTDAAPVLIATVASPRLPEEVSAKHPLETDAKTPRNEPESLDFKPEIPGIQPEAPLANASTPATRAAAPPPAPERRHPLRFVWQMDADGRFTIGSEEFLELVGPRNTAALGERWDDLAAALGVDPAGQVARAVSSHDTWSGLLIAWPVDDGAERLAVELSGLPVFDRDRSFRGYRGFGVCRDLSRLSALAQARARSVAATSATCVTPSAQTSTESAEIAPPVGEAPVDEIPPIERPVENIVPFGTGGQTDAEAPVLSPIERHAFSELARRLTTRLNEKGGEPHAVADSEWAEDELPDGDPMPSDLAESAKAVVGPAQPEDPAGEVVTNLFDPEPEEAPLATSRETRSILERLPIGVLVYRLEHLLYANRAFLDWMGHDDLASLAQAGGLNSLLIRPTGDGTDGTTFAVASEQDYRAAAEARLMSVQWDGDEAHALVISPAGRIEAPTPAPVVAAPVKVASMTQASQAEITPWKKAQEDLVEARRQAERTSSGKSDFLAKVSHEIRTPLNSIIGFSEVMMQERFGPIGNERYRDYLKDIRASGAHLIALINDLLDLSKIEAGKLELSFTGVALNELVQDCVATMQPQAKRDRVIIRSSLSPKLPHVMADARSLRQIVLNLLLNSLRHTIAGGQVIVSTSVTDAGEVSLRVRDTGAGMSEQEIAIALEPFRQLATSTRFGSGGSGLGLPLTKAMAEANRAAFHISSKPQAGTLVEVTFPQAKIAAE